MGLFSGRFAEGLVEGLAKSVERGVLSDMERMKDDTSMLSKVRFERGVREAERYEEQLRGNVDIIKDMSRKVGSTDNAQYLIDQYGFAEAQNVANTLYQKRQKSGGVFDINEALGLEQRQGSSVTANQLAEFVTPAMSIPEVTDSTSVAGGFMKLFGADPTKDIRRRSDAMLAEAGIPTDAKTSLVEMPETLKGRGIREWELYSLDDPAADAKRLMSVSQQMYTEANKTGNKDMLAEAYEARAAADQRLFEAKSLENSGSIYSEVDVQRSVSSLTAMLASANGVADRGEYQNGVYTTGNMAVEQATALSTAATMLTGVGSQAREAGVNATDIAMAQQKAVRENKILIFNPSDDPFVDGGTFSFGEKDSLIENASTLFPAAQSTQGKMSNAAQGNVTVNPPSNVAAALATQKAAYQNANAAGKQQIIQSLTNITNPATGQNYTAQEAQDYLES